MAVTRFGPFEVDRTTGELRRHGLTIRLREQSTRLLLALLDGGGSVVTRDELRSRLWPAGVFVEFDRAINKAVCELRRALDRPDGHSFIETVPKRGYRLAAELKGTSHRRSGVPRPATALPTDADTAYVTGRYLCSRRRVPDLYAGIACFEQSLALGGDEAHAHAGLASAHSVLGIWGVHPPDRAFGEARRAAARAFGANPGLAEGHNACAEVLKDYEWSWAASESHYRRALSIDPACASAHHGYAHLLACLGRHAEAIAHIELARRSDPSSAAITSYQPYIYLAARRYDRALKEAIRAVELEPYSALAHWVLGRACLFSGCHQAAVETLERGSELAGHASMWLSELCYVQGAAGNRAVADRLAAVLCERSRHEYVSPFDLAIAFMGVGDLSGALDQIDQAFEQRVMRLVGLGDPEFDALRQKRRSLLRRIGLPDSHL
jgi:DNA-binding winged helix-turn-helix (wHTH) protein/Flp pilus assembly protein TadD